VCERGKNEREKREKEGEKEGEIERRWKKREIEI
jgi:hypothetical protein